MRAAQLKQSPIDKPNYQLKTVLIVGGSGFIGQALVKQLVELSFKVTIYTRNLAKTKSLFLSSYLDEKVKVIDQLDIDKNYNIVINLAGKPLDENRWNDKVKQQIIASRVQATTMVTEFIEQTSHKPELLINGSAIGFYGPRKNQKLTEQDSGRSSFSHQLCSEWENKALKAEPLGVRVCLLRTGIVLGDNGGALSAMLLPFKLYLGGPLGHGNQWMSWIHIDDLVSMIIWMIGNESIRGPVNGVAPSPVSNQYFSETLASVLRRPAKLRMPALLAKLLFGEMADELLLKGQRVVPQVALDNGFKFEFATLGHALDNLLTQ